MSLLIPIHDGYTMEAKVQLGRGLPPLIVTYRPALADEVYDFLRAPQATGKEKLKAVTDLLSAHLKSWNAADETGAAAPVSAESLRRLPHRVLERLVDLVTGYAPSGEAEADAKN
jgi:hypothetical protein